jgi:hypothetical protein
MQTNAHLNHLENLSICSDAPKCRSYSKKIGQISSLERQRMQNINGKEKIQKKGGLGAIFIVI